jgi:uncharacterized protein
VNGEARGVFVVKLGNNRRDRKVEVRAMSSTADTPAPKGKQVSVNEQLFKLPVAGETPSLLGVRCLACGEVFFPKRTRCVNCFGEEVEEIALSKEGKLYSFTVVHHATPGYKGTVPYAVGAVELPEGIVILSPLAESTFETLKVGMKVRLVFEKLYDDDNGNEVISYKFKSY